MTFLFFNTGASTTTSTSIGTSTSSENILSKKQKEVEISFSRDTGVSYLEKLMTRRSRYDPSLLKKMVPKPVTTSVSQIVHEDQDSNDNEEMEYAPTRYNIFCDPDDDDLGDFSVEDCEELSRPMSSVQIQEITEPLVCNPHFETFIKPALPPQMVKASKTTQSKKRLENPQNSKVQSNRKKSATKTRPKSTGKRLSSKSPSRASDTDVQSSVQRAWANCSKEKQKTSQTTELSQFFLQGVESPTDASTDNTELNTNPPTGSQLNFAATIWLPFNSVPTDTETQPAAVIQPDSDSDTDDNEPPLTDLPSRCNSALSTHSQSHLELEQVTEREEWDKEDSEALESLAWELMSTIESEGRLSRCESVLDSIDYSSSRHNEGSDDVTIEPVDMSQVVSQFELYQQQLLDEEL